MSNESIVQELIETIKNIERKNMISRETEDNEDKNRIVSLILDELDKAVTDCED